MNARYTLGIGVALLGSEPIPADGFGLAPQV